MPPINWCVTCNKDMRCMRNGFLFATGKSTDNMVGYARCDLWECPECGFELLTGFGNGYAPPTDVERLKRQPILFTGDGMRY